MFSSNSSQVSDEKLYSEDVFSTFVYTGNGSTQTITNNIDLAGKGGLVWVKSRSYADDHALFDTSRGANNLLRTNLTNAQATFTSSVTSFNSSGFSLGSNGAVNDGGSGTTYASWTFREAPKFFDVVTYTGNGASDPSRSISHNLGVKPGFIIVKATSAAGDWYVVAFDGSNYRRSSAATNFGLNLINAASSSLFGGSSYLSATDFQLGAIVPDIDVTPSQRDKVNANGVTYVAYLFAHDATSDGIIQCGSFTTDGTGAATVNLGWEPQWLLFKHTTSSQDWLMFDTMRGLSQTNMGILNTNTSGTETQVSGNYIFPTSTGFQTTAGAVSSSATYIYIAIRRGPMKTPTTGTSVFAPVVRTGTGASATVTSGNTPDWVVMKNRSGSAGNAYTRLTGPNKNLYTNLTLFEIDQGAGYGVTSFLNSSFTLGYDANGENGLGQSIANWVFSRAPSFMDVVCYTGTGSARTVSHNLGVAPELTIFKSRSGSASWYVLYDANASNAKYAILNATDAGATATYGSGNAWSGQPTATTLSLGSFGDINGSGSTYVAYLFASCPGVSKVFSFTGNGSSQTINCGFSGGARFILIKRTDSTGNWVVFDSARGIVSGNDPSLLLNSTAAETNYDDIDPDSSGFVVNQSTNNLNVNGATYIGLAIS